MQEKGMARSGQVACNRNNAEKHHADQHAGQRQPQVLQANGFV